MKVILKETIEHLGTVGDVITVKDGYGRNFLLPQGLASLADKKSINAIEHQKAALELKRRGELEEAEGLANELNELSLTFARKTSDQDHLFGSVTNGDIEKAIAEKGYKVSRRNIVLDRPIKTLGEFIATVKLAGGVRAEIKITVEKDEQEEE